MSVDETREVIESYERGEGRVADHAVYVDTATGTSYEGREAIAGYFRHKHGEAFDTEFERTHLIVDDGQAVQAGYLVGKHVGEYEGVEGTGCDVRIPLVVIYEEAEGAIQRAVIHFGVYTFLQQVGALPDPSHPD